MIRYHMKDTTNNTGGSEMNYKMLILILSGLLWCFGRSQGWDEDITHPIGCVFWLLFIFG